MYIAINISHPDLKGVPRIRTEKLHDIAIKNGNFFLKIIENRLPVEFQSSM